MPRIFVPQNIGKVRVAKGVGGTYVVWNGKQGKGEFSIPCRTRDQATKLATRLNKGERGEVEIYQ